jgi:S-DNA-T family DNA segregation ATPase FtsK/SpoIIIE
LVTNPRAAGGALKEMLCETEERFERSVSSGMRNVQAWSQIPDKERLPHIVIIIDEMADLMVVAPAGFEVVITQEQTPPSLSAKHGCLAT